MLLHLVAAAAMAQALPPLHVDGQDLKDPDGRVVHLRGCNLGNWLMIEHWIWDQEQPADSSHDQYELENILARRFGAAEKDRLMNLYRSSWITDRDFDIIKSFRFNCIRLPLNYRLFEDDANPFHLRPDAWRWTDHAIDMATRHGIYVVLDMHGVQGGQNDYDHSGQAHQNKLWTTPEDQQRMAWLWAQVAARYKDNPDVVAYDLFNEPYGGEKSDIRKVWEQAYDAVRKVDPEKLVWAMGRYDGFEMYGDPKANGWHNVGIEMHYYPGLFGNGDPGIRTNLQSMASLERTVVPVVKKLDVPFFVGEMNVVFKVSGDGEMMRRTYDFYDGNGWGTTMWTYKGLSKKGGMGDDSWGMVTNRDPIGSIDFATDSESKIESFFASHATMPYAINENLRKYMAPEHVDLPHLELPAGRMQAPQGVLEGWTNTDVGRALAGGLETTADGFNLYGGGADIWGDHDQFQFLHKEATGDFDLSVTVNAEEDLGSYCKAGLMARSSLDSQSPFIMLSVFPSGEVQAAERGEAGKSVQGSTAYPVGFPLDMRLQRKDGRFICSYRKHGADGWQNITLPSEPNLGQNVSAGPIALSHDDSQLIKVTYSNLSLQGGSSHQ
jgi:glucan 1,3-beta-glucosidase